MKEISPLSVGVDALTVTSNVTDESHRISSRSYIANLAHEFRQLFWPNELIKYTRVPYALSAWSVESLSFIQKKEYCEMQLKGPCCNQALAALLNWDAASLVRYTRVDLCADYPLRYKTANYVYNLHKRLDKNQQAKSKLIVNSGAGDTLYFGSRESPSYGRIYDKSEAYSAKLGSIWRYEVEMKRVAAQRIAAALLESGDIPRLLVATIGKAYGKWGVILPQSFVPEELPKLEMRLTSDDMRLQWIRRQVLPSMLGLVERGKGDAVQDVLFPLFDALGVSRETMYD